jgi:hypothetical protein
MLSTKLKEAAGNSADATLYVDDVFSTWLYTGNGSTQTITNSIDLAGKGGLVWLKGRSSGNHILQDTVRGANNYLLTDSTAATQTIPNTNFVFGSTGFSMDNNYLGWNTTGNPYASWTFREAPKFFDVVTYTGTGSARTIAHSLGDAPGMIIVKRTDTTGNWQVYHRGLTSAAYSIQLNLTAAQSSAPTVWNSTAPTSSVFSVGTDATVNASDGTYVAYLYAHDAGGFGLTGTDNVISCGSYTGNSNATGPVVSLGYEPQYLMIKNATGTGNWQVIDSMRGMAVGSADATLQANLTNAESSVEYLIPTATGFQITSGSTEVNTSGSTYIYMAIRRPNKPPTTGTQVYTNAIQTTGITPTTSTTGFVTDLIIQSQSPSATNKFWSDRLRGTTSNNYAYVISNSTSAEATGTGGGIGLDNNTGFSNNLIGMNPTYNWNFKRAPGFFDVVCYTGNGASNTISHNLTAAPELIIIKSRNNAYDWQTASNFNSLNFLYTQISSNDAGATFTYSAGVLFSAQPTSTSIFLNSSGSSNSNGATYVAYLFATLAGISKVGSYTGNGTSQNIDCGFTAGARFFLVKATSTTGSWWVWDSARGITAGNDPALQLNATGAEITTADAVDPYAAGITVNQEATCSINASGVSYIYLAIS